MLQSIRDRTQSWLTSAVVGLLIIVFACWGIHGFLELNNGGNKIIAKVAGQTLSQRDFDASYHRLYQQAQTQLGINSPLNKEMINQLKKQTIEQWTLMQVLMHSAHQEHYRVSQSAIDSALLNMPIFQSTGRFSSTRFYSVLHAIGYTELQFLTELKRTLLINQVQQAITQSAFFLPEELNNTIALLLQKRDFAYSILSSKQFIAKQPVSEAEALSYYQNNKDHFIQPAQVSIEYIKLTALNNDKAFLEKRDILANLSYIHPDSLESAAKALGLPIQTSSLFDQMGGHEALTKNAKVIAAAFKPDILQGNNSPVIDLDAHTAIVLRIKQHKIATMQPFSVVKVQIIEDLKKQMASKETHAIGEQLIKEFKENSTFSRNNLNWHRMLQVDRNDDKLSSAIPNAVFNAVFDLPYPDKTRKTPLVTGFSLPNGDFALIKLLAVHDGDAKKLTASERSTYGKALEKSFGQLEYDLYVHDLMQKTT